MDIFERIAASAAKSMAKLWPKFSDYELVVANAPRTEFGDLSIPIMHTAQLLKEKPLDVAEKLMDGMGKIEGVTKITITAPGFVNFWLDYQWLAKELLQKKSKTKADKPQKISIEHTSVNPNKAAHIGHLRNAVLGDTLARVLRAQGNEVEVQNYIDDLGVQVADSVIAYETYGDAPEDYEIDEWFWEIYAKINQQFETHPELATRREQILEEMEKGECQTAKQIVHWIVERHLETFKGFGITYDLLVYEHDIVNNHLWTKLFEILKKKKLIHQPLDGAHTGAWVVEYGDSEREDKILVRSNGIVTYTGKDLAYALWKFGIGPVMSEYKKRLKPINEHVNVIDERQKYPQAVISHVMKKLGYEKEAEHYKHLSYGVVRLSDTALVSLGGKDEGKSSYAMSGRAGIGVMVNKLLHSVTTHQMKEHSNPEEVAKKIAVGAIRYYMLKSRPEREIIFDFDEALRTDGNTGVYLQYAYARACNIIDKLEKTAKVKIIPELNIAEQGLLKVMAQASQNLKKTVEMRSPSLLCDYAYDLASAFAKFYETSPVMKSEGEVRIFRCNLMIRYKELLGSILDMLGIPLINKI